MPGRLEGKTALVTGASRGLGKAIAKLLAAEGAKVAIAARSSNELNATAEEIEAAGGTALPFAGNIADDAFIERMFAGIKESFGRLDILVNNAAIPGVAGDIENLSTAKFREVLDVNVVAAFNCMKHAIRIMKENGGKGKIINIGSTRSHWSEQGGPGAYNASKFAIRALTETVARLMIEQKSQISVGMVCPGIADTSIHALPPYDVRRKNWLRPETVAAAVLHAVSAPDDVIVFDTTLFPSTHNVF